MAALDSKILEKYKREESLVRIKRRGIDEHNIYGFILEFSKKFILLAHEGEFSIDGWLVLDRKYITTLKLTKSDEYCKSILEREKLLTNIHCDFAINLSSYPALFRSLKKSKSFIIAEDERPKSEVFLIGPIARINKNSVSIRYFDCCGKWTGENRLINFNDIARINFGCRYVRFHQKYIKNK